MTIRLFEILNYLEMQMPYTQKVRGSSPLPPSFIVHLRILSI